jgi:hypothetical protein
VDQKSESGTPGGPYGPFSHNCFDEGIGMQRAGLRWPFLLLAGYCVALPDVVAGQSESANIPARMQSSDGQHDFDFEFGEWKAKLRRRLRPLTGSTTWVEYQGTSVVRRVWDGKANLGELDVSGTAGRIVGLSLRLYDPEARQWRISWANSVDGQLGPPMIGGFQNGRGEFYNQEMFNGRAIFVRFIFSDIRPDSFRLEQAFSDDGGKTWEPNWISEFTRVRD